MAEFLDSKLLTEEENRLYDLATKFYNDFINLDYVLGVDASEVADLTNRLKSIVMSRPVMREFAANGMYDNLHKLTIKPIKVLEENSEA